jgi:hypothetical protein
MLAAGLRVVNGGSPVLTDENLTRQRAEMSV